MRLEVQKMKMIEDLLLIQDKNSLKEINKLIQSSILNSPNSRSLNKEKKTFEEWNSQFKPSKYKLESIVPELGITLLEFRKRIFSAKANGKSLSFNQFKKELKSWKKEKNTK